MISFYRHPCLLTQPWWDLSAEKLLSSRKPTDWLSHPPTPRLSSPPFRLCCARLTPVWQQNVPALHLHVRAAFNKLNGVLKGHWEVISASPCTSVAIGVYHPIILWSSLACNGFEVPSSQGDGYKNRRLHR